MFLFYRQLGNRAHMFLSVTAGIQTQFFLSFENRMLSVTDSHSRIRRNGSLWLIGSRSVLERRTTAVTQDLMQLLSTDRDQVTWC
jgi:hypothetical protein